MANYLIPVKSPTNGKKPRAIRECSPWREARKDTDRLTEGGFIMPRKARRRAWGSVTEAARGKKYVLRWVENTPQGRRRRSRTVYGTYREACSELAKIQATRCDERAMPTVGQLYEARYLP